MFCIFLKNKITIKSRCMIPHTFNNKIPKINSYEHIDGKKVYIIMLNNN